MWISRNFKLQEFVGPEIYANMGVKALQLIDFRIVELAQFIRDFFDTSMTINNWHTGNTYTERGLRDFNSPTGAKYSQHKFGRAIDFTLEGFTAEQVRSVILKNKKAFMDAGLTTIEADTPTWVHCDIRFTGLNDILIVPFK